MSVDADIALVTHGNEFLKSGVLPPQSLWDDALKFCNRVDFVSLQRLPLFSIPLEAVIARNPQDWFHLLAEENCGRIRLHYRHSKESHLDYHLAGFVGGGGTWLIETVFERHSDYWANRWRVTKPNAPDRGIWSVRYARVAKGQDSAHFECDLEKARVTLSSTLENIGRFARQQDLPDWADTFDRAYGALFSSSPNDERRAKDLVAGSYSLVARQVLYSALIAWVFGAMGSWNDLGFDDAEDQKSYENLSAQLYQDICDGIVCAVNSY